MPISVPDSSWLEKHGLAIFCLFVVAGVCAYLFKLLLSAQSQRIAKCDAEKKEWADEKLKMTLERENLLVRLDTVEAEVRAEFDKKFREYSEQCEKRMREYAESTKQEIREIYRNAQEREDNVRGEFAQLMETVSERTTRVMDQNTAVLQKMHERFVGPRSRRY